MTAGCGACAARWSRQCGVDSACAVQACGEPGCEHLVWSLPPRDHEGGPGRHVCGTAMLDNDPAGDLADAADMADTADAADAVHDAGEKEAP